MTDEREGLPSASNAEADSLCPGRHLAQRGLPEIPKADADFGTAVHKWLKDPKSITLTPAQLDVAERAYAIEESVMGLWLQLRSIDHYAREQRFWRIIRGRKLNSGQIDAFWISGNYGLIADTKSLWGEHTEAPGNLQLRDEAVLLWLQFQHLTEIAVFINQPRATNNPTICLYNQKELVQAHMEMGDRVAASMNPESPRVAGEKQCRYCRAKLTCKEFLASSLAVATIVPAEVTKPKQMAEVVQAISTEKLCAIMERVPLAEMACKAAREEMKRRLNAGEIVPGWTLKAGNTLNPITDALEVYQRARAIGITYARFQETIDIGKGKLTEIVRDLTGLKGKALESKVEQLIEGCTTAKQNEPSLKRVKEIEE